MTVTVIPRIRDTREVISRVDAAKAKATVPHLAIAGLRQRSFTETELGALAHAAETIEHDLEALAGEIHG